jgi:hypothetical protein
VSFCMLAKAYYKPQGESFEEKEVERTHITCFPLSSNSKLSCICRRHFHVVCNQNRIKWLLF